MLESARRGPFAEPTASERVEYLVTRLRTERTRLDYENFALEHVLSYQRRVAATKDAFITRGKLTPLGIPSDWCLHLPSDVFLTCNARLRGFGTLYPHMNRSRNSALRFMPACRFWRERCELFQIVGGDPCSVIYRLGL